MTNAEDDQTPLSDDALDALLNVAPAAKASEALQARILDDFTRLASSRTRKRVLSLASFFSARRYLPAGALAGLGALGFAAGVASAQVSDAEIASQEEALYYASAAFSDAFSGDSEEELWAVD
ncbi:MAG: hypothetical protein AAGJ87_06205 [Pseudomonadota bacterium]